jgi:hypothetical protein
MIELMILQALMAGLYFYSAPFVISVPLWITLAINLGSLFKLSQIFLKNPEYFYRNIKILRVLFTGTLVLMELLIFLLPDPVGTSAFQSFINDAEVFITGILVGVLWQDRLITFKLKF